MKLGLFRCPGALVAEAPLDVPVVDDDVDFGAQPDTPKTIIATTRKTAARFMDPQSPEAASAPTRASPA
jgi:hypothetical protein